LAGALENICGKQARRQTVGIHAHTDAIAASLRAPGGHPANMVMNVSIRLTTQNIMMKEKPEQQLPGRVGRRAIVAGKGTIIYGTYRR
jgi:hypothetical protein